MYSDENVKNRSYVDFNYQNSVGQVSHETTVPKNVVVQIFPKIVILSIESKTVRSLH